MEQRILGRTGASVSVLGFGCGAVGGLMVRGAPADQERAVARALEAGINYFDTAPSYGNGASEENLGRVLKSLNPEIFLSTKFTVLPEHRKNLADGIAQSLEQSLRRLGRDHVDLLQLHNRIASGGSDRPLEASMVLQQVVPVLEDLRKQGKIRFFGITALGDTRALHQVVDAGAFDTAQICHNLLNPSSTTALQANFPAQDFEKLAIRAHAAGMGTIGIRVLAGGALSGLETRHPIGADSVDPIASGPDYRADAARAHAFQALVAAGYARSLIEAALRFAFASEAMTTVLVGTSTLDQLETAIASANKGPMTRAALDEAARLWRNIAGALG
ncbi:MAG TPA: aldo/keto reductase [Stellaceae bacterium]|jgi:L-galactose dehydrogenase/L-glyceraldehyde 3-phosphate reductase|nr:aldo/keto reductase [Stellaceae bacterium]